QATATPLTSPNGTDHQGIPARYSHTVAPTAGADSSGVPNSTVHTWSWLSPLSLASTRRCGSTPGGSMTTDSRTDSPLPTPNSVTMPVNTAGRARDRATTGAAPFPRPGSSGRYGSERARGVVHRAEADSS